MRRQVTIVHATAALLATLSLAACADSPVAPAAAPRAAGDVVETPTVVTASLAGDRVNLTIPTQFHAQNPCAGGRFGEIVVFQGDQHLVFFQSSTANGRLNTKVQWNAEGVTGIGQYTGFAYRATGVTQEHTVSGAPLPYSETMINNYHIVGQGQATNMDLHETVHITVNANGEVSAWVTDYNFSCKQDPTF
jgi:hypothetical protein